VLEPLLTAFMRSSLPAGFTICASKSASVERVNAALWLLPVTAITASRRPDSLWRAWRRTISIALGKSDVEENDVWFQVLGQVRKPAHTKNLLPGGSEHPVSRRARQGGAMLRQCALSDVLNSGRRACTAVERRVRCREL
jgi:hypothetical protein